MGCPIDYGASLGEVLEQNSIAPLNLMLDHGSRNDSKSFGFCPNWWDEVQVTVGPLSSTLGTKEKNAKNLFEPQI